MTYLKLYITIAALVVALLGMSAIAVSLKTDIAVKDIQLQASAEVIDAHKVSQAATNAIDSMRADFNARMTALQSGMRKGFKEAKQNDPSAKKWAEETVPCSVLATDPSIPDNVWDKFCGLSGILRISINVGSR